MKTNLSISDFSASNTREALSPCETEVVLVNLGKTDPPENASVTMLEPGETHTLPAYHALYIRDGADWYKCLTGQVAVNVKGPIIFTAPQPIADIKAVASDLYAARHTVFLLPELMIGVLVSLLVIFMLTGGQTLPISAFIATCVVWGLIGVALHKNKMRQVLSRPGVIFFNETYSHIVKFSPPPATA